MDRPIWCENINLLNADPGDSITITSFKQYSRDEERWKTYPKYFKDIQATVKYKSREYVLLDIPGIWKEIATIKPGDKIVLTEYAINTRHAGKPLRVENCEPIRVRVYAQINSHYVLFQVDTQYTEE